MFFNLLNLALHIKLIIKKDNRKIILSHKQFIIRSVFHSIQLLFHFSKTKDYLLSHYIEELRNTYNHVVIGTGLKPGMLLTEHIHLP